MTGKLSPKEAADILGVSTRRVQALIKQGRLPAKKNRYGFYELSPAKVAEFAKVQRKVGQPRKKKVD